METSKARMRRIAGFPGETESEFEALLEFMRQARIDRAGCFAYSAVDGAVANELPGLLPQAEREQRRARFMAVAEDVSAVKLRERVGARVPFFWQQELITARRTVSIRQLYK